MGPLLSILRIKQLVDLRKTSENNISINGITKMLKSIFRCKISLGMPDTSFNGRKTRIARNVRRFSFAPSAGNMAINLFNKEKTLDFVNITEIKNEKFNIRRANNKKVHNVPNIP